MLDAQTRPDPSRQRWNAIGKPDLPAGKAVLAEVTVGLRNYCVVLVSLALLFFHAQAFSGGWTKKADLPRGGGSASVVNGKIYILGGTTNAPSYADLAYNEVYDPSTNTWLEKAPMPTSRGFLSTAVVNDAIYAIGGGYPTAKNTVEAYEPAKDTWTARANMLGTRLGARAAVVDGVVYNIGGNYSQRNCEAYDPSTNAWTSKTPIPESGGVLSVTVYDGLIYAFGGGYYGAYSTVYAYDPKADTWTKKRNMPTPRFAFQTYLVDGKIYAIGGAQATGGASLSAVEVYDPVSDTWETKAPMPNNLAWLTGSVVNGKIYVIGGTPDWGITMSSSVWEYDPAFHTDIAAGNVSGNWTLAQSPYHINGEVTIPNDSTLTIEPGVEVVFMGHYKFNVQGRLLALGTPQDSIHFTAANTQTGWHGMRFNYTPNMNDTSRIVYCSFKHGKANTGDYSGDDRRGGAIFIRGFSKVSVSKSLFESNMNDGYIAAATGGAAIYVSDASPTITHSTFLNNTGTTDCAILCWYTNAVISNNTFVNNSGPHGPVFCAYYSPTISGNIISHNLTTRAGGGIFLMTAKAQVNNNVIIYNRCYGGEGEGGGIKCWINDQSAIVNNTIAYNSAAHGGGICCNSDSDPVFFNNIIWGNTSSDGSQVNLLDTGSDPHFVYCDIQGRREAFGGNGAGTYYTGIYEGNIDLDPLFKDSAAVNFSLSDPSHCIGAGHDSVEILGNWYYAPPFCKMGNPRPSPSGTRPDIGACESLLGTPHVVGEVEEGTNSPERFVLLQNYPNPFNPKTVIRYQLPVTTHVWITVYDVMGREVSLLVDERREAGVHEIEFDAAGLASGLYFCRMEAGDFVQTRELLLLR